MNKFAKGCLVTAITFLFIGIVISTVGRLGGGREEVRKMEENGELRFINDHLRVGFLNGPNISWWKNSSFHWGSDGLDLDLVEDEPIITYDTYDDHDTHHDIADQNAGNISQSGEVIDASSIMELDIELGGGYLYIDQDDSLDSQIRIIADATEDARVSCYEKKGTLHIEGFKNQKWNVLSSPHNNYIYVFLPKDFAFQKSEIELGAGYIEINNGIYGKTEIEVGAGEIVCNGIKTGKMEAEVGAGNAVITDVEADALDFSVDMGSVTIERGAISGNIELSCDMGSLCLWMQGTEEEYNYDIECAMGSILIGDSEYAGLGREKYINNHAAKEFKAECNMGSIEVEFID